MVDLFEPSSAGESDIDIVNIRLTGSNPTEILLPLSEERFVARVRKVASFRTRVTAWPKPVQERTFSSSGFTEFFFVDPVGKRIADAVTFPSSSGGNHTLINELPSPSFVDVKIDGQASQRMHSTLGIPSWNELRAHINVEVRQGKTYVAEGFKSLSVAEQRVHLGVR